MDLSTSFIEASYHGQVWTFPISSEQTLKDLNARIASAFGLVNVKLVSKGGKLLSANANTLGNAGMHYHTVSVGPHKQNVPRFWWMNCISS